MCAQCNNKKSHIHTVKPIGAQTGSVRVEAGRDPQGCCASASVQTVSADQGSEASGSDSGGDEEPAGRPRISAIHPSANVLQPAAFKCSPAALNTGPETDHAHHSSVPHDHGKSGTCCSTSHTAEENEPESLFQASADSHSLSWKIQNMDCPSCAGKLEKAISAIEGVYTVKVMFATEKLMVSCGDQALATVIESKASDTGFPLISSQQSSEPAPQGFWRRNAAILSIAFMMLASFLVSQVSETFGLAAFTATTILGLIPIVRKAVALAKGGSPFSIETLMSVAAIGALYLGETAEAAMVLLLFLLGEQLEGYASARARSGVKALMDLVPEQATLVRPDGTKVKVAAEALAPGDVIEVAPGGRLPADGELMDISASFDESALTGESVPVERLPGESVMAGSLVADKVVRLKIVSAQGENAIDRILHLIEDAESRKAPLERFIDRFSRWYTPAMIALAALVIVIPPMFFAQSWEAWLYKGLTLLLIACPCALVISIPAAITSGLAAAARRGALIKGGAALEQLGRIDLVAFDKTGTLTQGKPVMTDLVSWDGDEARLLQQAAAVEDGSMHPLAQAVVKAAASRGLPVPHAEHREALPGRGIMGVVDGDSLLLVAADRLPEEIQLTVAQQAEAEALEAQGKTLVVAIRNREPVGLIAWRDNLREETPQAVRQLHAMGIRSVMLTGDNPRAAAAIAGEIKIDYRAGLLPADKVREVELANQHAKVAMVGDGINDAPAMKTAAIGIAMGGGTDVALETADAALTHDRVAELPAMIALSRATLANIRQNIGLALGLKALFLVTTLLGFTGLWVAVLADSGATALVTLNALRLLRFKPRFER
ncbi:zinc/cadmium/mercury/lead-transporting ATPase [Photobacterium sp. TY1-4]|uniref:zinc/cadmium/mercury/lead-transporting ATPase n=1 Tax=Photobacterium sp. TY1-4 TaxID=2899122 RepID=UPI0021BECDB5|nr:zinc/cadmium/mercury/lead-transporting ATPase [Photobacterium sp. TY1-4]UXI00277.1 zinc/cadmium/mercury/lead-transporting ATPase [Photobacterium sp. TY1-4]